MFKVMKSVDLNLIMLMGLRKMDTFPIFYYTHVEEGYLTESFRRTSYTEHSLSVLY